MEVLNLKNDNKQRFKAGLKRIMENKILIVIPAVYVGVMLSYVFRIRCMEAGFVLIWLVFICSWISHKLWHLCKNKITCTVSYIRNYGIHSHMTEFIWIYPYFILPCTLILYKILVTLLLRLIRICRNGKHISESR